MINLGGLNGELGDLAKTVGLLDADGNFNDAWFNNPLTKLQTVLADAGQRQALLRLLDALLPPRADAAVPAGEKWHPLLPQHAAGNAYLTVREEAGELTVGVAGDYGTLANATPVSARLSVRLPLVRATASVTALPGTSDGPLIVRLRIGVNITPAATGDIALRAITVEARVQPSGFKIMVVLEGLSLEGEPAIDKLLDPSALGGEAPELLAGLLKHVLAADASVGAAVGDALGLLGLAETAIPAFPFAELGQNPAAVQDWIKNLFTGTTPPINDWLGHFGGLFRSLFGGTPPIAEAGASADSYSVALVPFSSDVQLRLQVALVNNHFRLGLAARATATLDGKRANIEIGAALADIPLAGTGRARMVPEAAARLSLAGTAGDLIPGSAFHLGAVNAGLRWDGAALQPLLEVTGVRLDGQDYPRLDLTNTDSVAAAVSNLIMTEIDKALGGGTVGRRIAALAGLVPPRDPNNPTQPLPGWTRTLDLGRFVTDPLGTIAKFHRDTLLDTTHGWDRVFGDLAALIPGLAGSVGGTGTPNDPWRIALAPAVGPLQLELAAWNAQTSGLATDDQQLRIGLRLAATQAPLDFAWRAELLAFDLPASGPGQVRLVGAQALRVAIAPAFSGELFDAEVIASVTALAAEMHWAPGTPIQWRAGLDGIRIDAGSDSITVPSLALPPAPGFDLSNPVATAAAFGLTPATLEKLLSLLVAHAASGLGDEARDWTALLGLHRFARALPVDWPTWADVASPGRLLTDPLAAARAWLQRLLTSAAADGSAHAQTWLEELRAVLGRDINPDALAQLGLHGAGTYDEPWTVPLPGAVGATGAQLHLWLDPAGASASLASGMATLAGNAADFTALLPVLRDLGHYDVALRARLSGRGGDGMSAGLALLADLLERSDGVVPLAAQTPTLANWDSPETITASHWALPATPAAIDLIAAQVDTWAGGSDAARVVLLLAPQLAGADPWSALLASAKSHGSKDLGACFILDDPSIPDPLHFPLEGVTAAVDWYVLQLPNDDLPAWATHAQLIGRVVERLGVLRPGVPVTLVAHSTLGLAARHYAAGNPDAVRGLITLGTPHLGANLPFLADPDLADAIRVAQCLAASLPAGAARAAIESLSIALDGYAPAPAAGQLPLARRFPFAAFDTTGAALDLGTVPVFAIGAVASATSLFDLIKGAAQAGATLAAGTVRPAPTHLGLALSLALDLPAADGDAIAAEARLRVDLLEIPLSPAAPPAPRPTHGLRFHARLYRRNGWLMGDASTLPFAMEFSDPRLAFGDVRLREVEIGLDASLNGSTTTAQPWLRLTDAALHGPTLARVDGSAAETRALAQGVLGELFSALASGVHAPGSPALVLFDALSAIGVAAPNAQGVVGLAADAWSALEADALGYLGVRLPAALASAKGWLGLSGPPEGPWTWAPADAPVTLGIQRGGTSGPWSVVLKTALADGADNTSLSLSCRAEIALPSLAVNAQVGLQLGVLALDWDAHAGALAVRAQPWLDGLTLLPPPSPAVLQSTLAGLWPRLLFSGGIAAALRAVAPTLRVTAVERFFTETEAFIQDAFIHPDGTGFSVPRIRGLLDVITQAAGLPPSSGTLALPGGLRLRADGDGTATSPLRLTLATTTELGGVLNFAVGVDVDPARHATPHADLTLTLPLDGTWGEVGINFGIGAQGVILALEPGGGADAIQLLPTFSGLGALRGAAEALLPRALDEAVTTVGTPQPVWLQRLLGIAAAFDLYAVSGGFAAKTDRLRALLAGNALASFDDTLRHGIADAAVQLLQAIPSLPGSAALDGNRVRLNFTPPVELAGTIGLSVGFDGAAPSIGVTIDDLHIAGVLVARLSLAAGPGGLTCDGGFGVDLHSIRVPVTPRLDFLALTGSGGGFQLRVYPLATGIASGVSGPLEIAIAPSFNVTFGGDSVERILTDWALPLVANTALGIAHDHGLLTTKLWATGPTVHDVLLSAQLVDGSDHLVTPLPEVWPMVSGALAALATGVEVPIGDLKLKLLNDGGHIGIGLKGEQKFNTGNIAIGVLFGAPQEWTQTVAGDTGTPEVGDGLELFLIRLGSGAPTLEVALEVDGVGVGIYGSDGRALLDDPSVHIGGVGAYLFMKIDAGGGPMVSRLGGGLRIHDFGLPLGAVTGGGAGGNPVASSLLNQGGAGRTPQPPNPGVDIDVWYREDDRLHVRLGGAGGVLWIGVHSKFGPIYIDQVGVRLTSAEAGLLVDGGLQVAGLAAQVDDLGLTIPYATAGRPDTWRLDLKGLGLGYSAPGVTITGALVKYDNPLEYDGMLIIKVGTIGALAVGSFSVPAPAGGDSYTSLAIFGGVFIPIGITPIINITALGLGLGLNRRLIVPEDLNQIPNFMLIEALDRPEALANDPLGALLRFRDAVPPKRGALWLAAGLRGTSFEIVHITAVLYVALDGGVGVGLLGVARAALPADDAALVSIELALKARFSSAEMLFSIQAQLTDNSWLLSHDCQLTGGFAFFMWFRESQFLLTLGGYHPAFQPRPEYPTVPRLGYRWDLLGVIHIKGESYFALTNTCVMAGTLMEVTYGPDWLQLWFHANADFLAQWDPFYFMADIGVSVGARLRVKVWFATITVSVSVGASLHLEGPPLHGTVTVDLLVTSVTVPFGDTGKALPDPIPWEQFKLKYLLGSDPATLPVGLQISSGLLPAEPPGAPVAPGSEAQPWQLAAEWSFQTETRMPARAFTFVDDTDRGAWSDGTSERFAQFNVNAQTYDLDIAPMRAEDVTSAHRVYIERLLGGTWQRLVAADLDRDRFVLEPRFGQVSEAAYRLYDGLPPAAANTLPALLGLIVHGIAELKSTTPTPIPIAKLRDATHPRPLPFTQPESIVWADIQVSGRQAERYFTLGATLQFAEAMAATAHILHGPDPVFGPARVDSGLPESGLGPVAANALLQRRSAPPLVAPLSAGLSMKPVAQALPVDTTRAAPVTPVALQQPRLRSVMQARLRATESAPPTLRTTVNVLKLGATRLAAAGGVSVPTVVVNRDLVHAAAVTGAKLVYIAAHGAPQATRFAATATSVRHPEVGAAASRAQGRDFAQIEKAALDEGALIRAGVTQLWDVPLDVPALVLQGDQAVRVTLLSRGGGVLADREYATASGVTVDLPDNCAMVAVSGLGRLGSAADGWQIPAGPGAVTAYAAPAGRAPVVGWQSSDEAMQLTGSTLLARGAVVRMSHRAQIALHQQTLPHGVVSMAAALTDATAVETQLAPHVRVVAIILEATSARLPGDDDLEIAVDNVTLAAMPVRVGGGQCALMLFDVTRVGETALAWAPFRVTIKTASDVRLTGVIGLPGSAREWGEKLNGKLPEDWVPDEPLSFDGNARVRFAAAPVPRVAAQIVPQPTPLEELNHV